MQAKEDILTELSAQLAEHQASSEKKDEGTAALNKQLAASQNALQVTEMELAELRAQLESRQAAFELLTEVMVSKDVELESVRAVSLPAEHDALAALLSGLGDHLEASWLMQSTTKPAAAHFVVAPELQTSCRSRETCIHLRQEQAKYYQHSLSTLHFRQRCVYCTRA